MITTILLHLTNFITQTIGSWGYAGVILLMAIESCAIPLPSEVIMPFAGFLAASGRFSLLGLGIAGAVGSLLGSWVTYALGYFAGRALILQYGRYVLISEHDLKLTERFFQKFGSWSTFFGRLLPLVRTFISIPAGIGEEPILPFSIAAFAGSFVWSYFLAWLGLRLGENWQTLGLYFRKFDILIVLLIIIFLVYWVWRHAKHLRN